MHTPICDRLGIEVPIFAFSHCRDVVAAESRAGGFGVLGAVGFTPEQLEVECRWIDEHVGNHTYGVDIVIPGKYEGMGEVDPAKLEEHLRALVPQEHRDFAAKLLRDHGVPELPEDSKARELIGWTAATANPQIDVALAHPKVRAIANALGTPPEDVIGRVQQSGRLIGALCGSPQQARKHKEAGLDFVIAQGTEGGGHTGEIGSVVLWPQVVDAVAPIPVLAAGGIATGRQIAAALALGCAGVWAGSLWLAVEEAEAPQAQRESYFAASSKDTVRSRSFTGKPCRMLRNEWTDAWEQPDAPKPLGMPLQGMVTMDTVARTHRYADKAQPVAFNPIGQVVGMIDRTESVRDLMLRLQEQYLAAVERLDALQPADA